MDLKQKQKQYYIDNRDKIIQRNKQYYYDNKVERQRYNNEYWALHGHKYIKKRSENIEHKTSHTEYNIKYKEKSKHIYQNNYFKSTSLNDLIVTFD